MNMNELTIKRLNRFILSSIEPCEDVPYELMSDFNGLFFAVIDSRWFLQIDEVSSENNLYAVAITDFKGGIKNSDDLEAVKRDPEYYKNQIFHFIKGKEEAEKIRNLLLNKFFQ